MSTVHEPGEDRTLLEDAMWLLVLLERNYDPHLDTITVSKQAWLDLTRPFRDRMVREVAFRERFPLVDDGVRR